MVKKNIGDTSYKETKYGILPRRKIILLEAKGTGKGLILLKKLVTQDRGLTISLIKKIHKDCFSDILPGQAGTFRTIQVQYSGKEAPHYSRVHEMMKNLCDDTEYSYQHLPHEDNDNYIYEVIKILSAFQHRFLVIHPFVDYNGRLARMFTSYILMRLHLPIIEIEVKTEAARRRYITSLQEADQGNYQNLNSLLTQALNESLHTIQTKMSE